MQGPIRDMNLKLRTKERRTRWVTAVAMCAVLMLPEMGLDAIAQDTTTLLVLRPQPKGIASDRIRTVTPGQGANVVPSIISSQITEIRIGGKPATITAWTPLLNGPTHLQLVVLFDSQLRIGLGTQFDEIKALFNSLPSNVEIAVGEMLQGEAVIKQSFTTDRVLAGSALHLPTMEDSMNPTNVSRGLSCLHDLAIHWPDPDPKKVRAVLLFTGGGGGVPSIDLERAGIAPFAVFYINLDLEKDGVTYTPDAMSRGVGYVGQDNLDFLTKLTNGEALYYPHQITTTFTPLLSKFYSILSSEAVVTVTVKGSGLQPLDIKSTSNEIKIVGPDHVMIGNELPTK